MAALTRTTRRAIAAVVVLGGAAVIIANRAFGLSIGGAVAIYFIVWWTVLFAVLPFAARHGAGADVAGADPGAPALPRLREKAVWTTVWSDLVFLVAAAALPLAGL